MGCDVDLCISIFSLHSSPKNTSLSKVRSLEELRPTAKLMAMDLLPGSTRWITCLPRAWALLWFLAALIGGSELVHARELSVQSENNIKDGSIAAYRTLGRIVYLPSVSLETDHNSDAFIFDAEDMNSIANWTKESYTDSNSNFFESSDKFKESIAAEMGISGSAKGVSFSVDSEFKRVSGRETDVRVAEVHAVRYHSKTFISRGVELIRFPLKAEFLNDFCDLPTIVDYPQAEERWSPFADFMRKWGSHIVISAYTGSVFESSSSATSNRQYSEFEMKVKACVKAEGMNGTGALSACAGISQSQREESQKMTTTDRVRVKGGTAKTRSELSVNFASKELLQQFLNEDDVDEQPVKYEYMAIWNLMLARSKRGSAEARRARGLEAYYVGWRSIGCPVVMTSGQTFDYAQLMVPELVPSGEGSNIEHTGFYLCIRRCAGCHNYAKDCHYQSSVMCCRSYGPSVLAVDSSTDRVSVASNWDSGWCDYPNGCNYITGYGCACTTSNSEAGCNYEYPRISNDGYYKFKVIWNQHEGNRALDFKNVDSAYSQIASVTDE